jgi:adenosylmethionine-8-amino-7-oxononanoate aminotransferase
MTSPATTSTTIAGGALPKIAYGRGVRLWDTDGKRYIDGSSGPAVFALGHSHPEVNEAIVKQLEQVAHGYRYTFTSDPLEELTERIAVAAGADLTQMVFVSGGSEAVESCMKLALQYQSAIGQPQRRRFISRQRSWHGNTLGALSISGFLERRAPYEGALLDVVQLSPVNAYRPPESASADDVAHLCAAELEDAIIRLGADTIAAFIFEPVVGAAGGVVPAPPGYAARVREICDRHGVVMIADEVMCGAGRCGTWRALAHDGVEPDVMAIAKGLGAGYIPIGAAVYGNKVADAIKARYGGPMTGHTFTGHTLACAAAAAVQRIVARDQLTEHARIEGARFKTSLGDMLSEIEAVGDVRGRGLFVGIELVKDRHTKKPFDSDVMLYARIQRHALANGLICYPSGGNVDGRSGDTVILAPPLIATANELDEIADLFARSVRAALAEVGAA